MFKKMLCLAFVFSFAILSIFSVNAAFDHSNIGYSGTDNIDFGINNSYGSMGYYPVRYIPAGFWDNEVSQYEHTSWSIEFLIGDANLDGKINVKDASAIQKNIAVMQPFSIKALYSADTDRNQAIAINDATAIQKYAIGIELSEKFQVGKTSGCSHSIVYP